MFDVRRSNLIISHLKGAKFMANRIAIKNALVTDVYRGDKGKDYLSFVQPGNQNYKIGMPSEQVGDDYVHEFPLGLFEILPPKKYPTQSKGGTLGRASILLQKI